MAELPTPRADRLASVALQTFRSVDTLDPAQRDDLADTLASFVVRLPAEDRQRLITELERYQPPYYTRHPYNEAGESPESV